MKLLVAAMLLVACGDNKAARQWDAALDTPMSDAPPDVMFDAGPRGPAMIGLTGTVYGALWDDAASTLYITDDTNNRLMKWTDAGGLAGFGNFPTVSPANVMGGIVQLPDKSFLVPVLGAPSSGTILTMSADGTTPGTITGLAGTQRRIGITYDPNSGLVWEAFFTGSGTMMQTGGVAGVEIVSGAGTETPIVTTSGSGPVALKKVVGIVATATTLYVCDQTATPSPRIYAITKATGDTSTFATPPSCDLMLVLPNGDFATGGLTGGVYRITPQGAVTSIHSGFEQVRGIAYDPTLKRMFVIEFRATLPTMPRLHIFPLDG